MSDYNHIRGITARSSRKQELNPARLSAACQASWPRPLLCCQPMVSDSTTAVQRQHQYQRQRRLHRVARHVSAADARPAAVTVPAPAAAATGSAAAGAEQGAPGSCLVVGASRGIGLGLARTYAEAGWTVHATTRTPTEPGLLGDLAGDVRLHECDCNAPRAGAALAEALGAVQLDVMVYNAGINQPPAPLGRTGEGSGFTDSAVLFTNGIAPFQLIEHILPLIRPGGKLGLVSSEKASREIVGEETSEGMRVPPTVYGLSKMLLNDGFRQQASRWKETFGLLSLILHPGWVQTEMGQNIHLDTGVQAGGTAALTIEESAEGMREVLAGLSEAQSGSFVCWDGRELPW
jgi:NAD(P)-dependent dehydrogenase (short-subunit alcohol dehydrogenase family)